MRMNVRGVIRVENGFTKKYIVEVEKNPLEAVVSMNAMQQSDKAVSGVLKRGYPGALLGTRGVSQGMPILSMLSRQIS